MANLDRGQKIVCSSNISISILDNYYDLNLNDRLSL